jgi:hypothetical protein
VDDASGEMDPTPAVVTWTLDYTPPTTALISPPAPLSAQRRMELHPTCSDGPGQCGFQARLDGAATWSIGVVAPAQAAQGFVLTPTHSVITLVTRLLTCSPSGMGLSPTARILLRLSTAEASPGSVKKLKSEVSKKYDEYFLKKS